MQERLVEAARSAFVVLHAAVAFVLLIVRANVANLLLARAEGRRREMAIRSGIGASRTRLIGQVLTESLLLSQVGGAVGVLLAHWGIALLPALSPRVQGLNIPLFDEINVDGRVLVIMLFTAVAAGVAFGLAPAVQVSKLTLSQHAPGGPTQHRGTTAHRLLGAFVVYQMVLSVVLLVGAVLLIRNFSRLAHVDPGIDPHNFLALQMELPESRYPSR